MDAKNIMTVLKSFLLSGTSSLPGQSNLTAEAQLASDFSLTGLIKICSQFNLSFVFSKLLLLQRGNFRAHLQF